MSSDNYPVTHIEVDIDALIAESKGDLFGHIARLQHDYEGLRLTPYTGLDPKSSLLAGGRLRGKTIEEVIELVKSLNKMGLPVAIALTGSGGKYRRDNAYNHAINLKTDPVYPLLETLVRGGEQHAIRNSLTLLRDDVLLQLNELFPGNILENWASCIRFVGNLDPDEYLARLNLALSLYPGVVIDNPSTEKVLDMRLTRGVDQLVIFLNSKCCIDSRICNAHYSNIEKGVDLYLKTEGLIKETLDVCQQESFSLINRPALLSKAVGKNIRKYKWQRGSSYSFEASLRQLQSLGVFG